MAHACVTPEIALNLVPLLIEWNNPVSVETHTSPVMLGLTTTLTGDVEAPKVPTTVNEEPELVDK